MGCTFVLFCFFNSKIWIFAHFFFHDSTSCSGLLWISGHIWGIDGLIDMEQKGYELRCGIHCMTFTFDPTHDLDLGFSRSNFQIDDVGSIYYPTLGCDIQGLGAMGLSVQYWPRWFQDFPAIWLAVPFGANGAHLGICTLPEKKSFFVWNKLFLGEISFPKGELVLWSLYGDKLSLCRNQQMNGKI